MKLLTKKQLSSLLQKAMEATNTTSIETVKESLQGYESISLTTPQRVQFANYALERAMEYKNTHSMNRTILIAAIIQIIE